MAETVVNGVTLPFLPVGGVEGLKARGPIELPKERSFDTILEGEFNKLKFSKHAQQRLESRNIELNDADLSSLQHAVDLAEKKGAQESLVLLRDLAFIVNVSNKTVVTALDGKGTDGNVFTNIDSAVIAH
ncbi:MAG TPA: flagellar protein [Bacteroidetes bacterium]|nr:flagellar protein [Bacteroidota bacterium]